MVVFLELNSIAFIPDGNRRYASNAGISLAESYALGTKKAWDVLEWMNKYKEIKTGTFYTLSLENTTRKKFELSVLFKIFEKELDKVLFSPLFEKFGIKLNFIGKISALPKSIQNKMLKAEHATAEYDKKQINLALAYNGQQEIVDASKKIAEEYSKGRLSLDELTPKTYQKYLYDSGLIPDFIIRTSGSQRLSGFLTYQSSYSEFAFIPKFWPEFTENDLDSAIQDFHSRKRNFGKWRLPFFFKDFSRFFY